MCTIGNNTPKNIGVTRHVVIHLMLNSKYTQNFSAKVFMAVKQTFESLIEYCCH